MKEGKEKAPRNKTIDFSLDSAEGKKYRKRIMEIPKDAVELKTVLDQTICGDSFTVMDRLHYGLLQPTAEEIRYMADLSAELERMLPERMGRGEYLRKRVLIDLLRAVFRRRNKN